MAGCLLHAPEHHVNVPADHLDGDVLREGGAALPHEAELDLDRDSERQEIITVQCSVQKPCFASQASSFGEVLLCCRQKMYRTIMIQN